MQTLSQGYTKTQEGLFDFAHAMNAAQRAVARWSVVDDHHALLDLCCPNMSLLRHFSSRFKVRACALLPRYGDSAAALDRMGNAEAIRGDAADIPWQDQSFHTVFLSEQPDTALREESILEEVRRVLRKDGSFIAAVPLMGHENSLFSFRRRKELVSQLKAIGFADVSLRFAGLGYLTMVARNESA